MVAYQQVEDYKSVVQQLHKIRTHTYTIKIKGSCRLHHKINVFVYGRESICTGDSSISKYAGSQWSELKMGRTYPTKIS